MQVSKWIKIPFLVDVHVMEDLLMNIPPFKIYDVQKLTEAHSGIYDASHFLEGYHRYISCLKRGEIPSTSEYNSLFAAAWSIDKEALASLPTQNGRRLLKAVSPVVQIQLNHMRFASEEKVFLTQVYGSDTICFGIQVGFPHLFLDPQTHEAVPTRTLTNMSLFSAIQKWIRYNTLPTPFIVQGEKINSPVRLGKECFSWIASHPQLKHQNIHIRC
jgi:hypothetical protein